MTEDLPDAVRRMTEKMLGMQLYVAITRPAAPRERIMAMLPAHLEHQVRLEKAGIMFGAGPLTEEDGSGGTGMIIVRAESFEAARAIVDADPLHQSGLRTYTIQRWTLNEGSFSVRISYSDQTATIA